jgi:hypothetical protein
VTSFPASQKLDTKKRQGDQLQNRTSIGAAAGRTLVMQPSQVTIQDMTSFTSQSSGEGPEANKTLFFADLSLFVTEEALAARIRKICRVKSVKLGRHPETQDRA